MTKITILNNTRIPMSECCDMVKQIYNRGFDEPGLFNTLEYDKFHRCHVSITKNERSLRFEFHKIKSKA